MIKKFETYMNEGRMGKLIDAAKNNVERKEDDVDRLDFKNLIEYLNDKYKIKDAIPKRPFAHGDEHEIVCDLEYSDGGKYVLYRVKPGAGRPVDTTLFISDAFYSRYRILFDKLKDRFRIKEFMGFVSEDSYYSFMPLESDNVTNSFFIEVIDAITSILPYDNRLIITEGRMGKLIDAAKNDVERKEDQDNIRFIKPIDLGLNILWADRCYVDSNGEKYFSWNEMHDFEKDGWRLPTKEEAQEFLKNIDFENSDPNTTIAVSKKNGKVFPMEKNGVRLITGEIKYKDRDASFWTSDEYYGDMAYQCSLYFSRDHKSHSFMNIYKPNKDSGYSILLVRNK